MVVRSILLIIRLPPDISSRQIKLDSIFTNYRIQSNANNEITMVLPSEALLAALKSASASSPTSSFETEEVVMRLAKKNDQALLSFEISGLTRVGRKVRVAHDVKIEVLKAADVEKLSEPMCPEPDVSFSSHRYCESDELTFLPGSHTVAAATETQNDR